MTFKNSAFVMPNVGKPTLFLGMSVSSATSRQVQLRQSRKRSASRIFRATATAKDAPRSGKKKGPAAPVFATDMKGNFVWTLRGATSEDVMPVSALLGDKMPSSMIAAFIEDSGCCVVCEVSVKGTKEGEGYSSRIMGAALVDVSVEVRDKTEGFSSGLVKKADLLGVVVDPVLPSGVEVRKKLLLGAMKKLKEKGAIEITTSISSNEEDKIALLKGCLFKAEGTGASRVTLRCKLGAENPDPQKKML